ncbi:MAG: hypothetical protein V4582_14060 [Pseudomonadota bacterium]
MKTWSPLPVHGAAPASASESDWLARVPVPIFGGALGLLGLHLVAAIHPTLSAMPLLRAGSLVSGCAVLAIGIVLHLARLAQRRAAFVRDAGNAALMPFFAQLGIALLLLAEAARALQPHLAFYVFALGSALSAALSAYWLVLAWRMRFALASVSPGWLVPPIAWLYIALLAPAFDDPALARVAFIVGCALALVSLVLLGARLLAGPPLPTPARPALAVGVAIPALLLLVVLDDPKSADSFAASALYIVTACAYVAALLALVPVVRARFMVSWWAFGMPLLAAAIAFDAYAKVHGSAALAWFAQAAACIDALIVGALVLASVAGVRRHLG